MHPKTKPTPVINKDVHLLVEAEHSTGQGRRQIRWLARIIPLSVISEGNEYMDNFSHICDAALSIFGYGALFLAMDHLRNLLVSATSIDPMSPATADIFLQCSMTGSREAVRGRRYKGQRHGTWSSPPWSSRVIMEELPTHVPDLQCCSLKWGWRSRCMAASADLWCIRGQGH